MNLLKYPRIEHLIDSKLQPGDKDLSQIPFAALAGKTLAVEGKIDGANTGVSFGSSGNLLLQSRGHYLFGGGREKHYDLLKTLAQIHQRALRSVLGNRYIMYGEWMYAKHTVYYNNLPHYFLEFDLFDREQGTFLDTPGQEELRRNQSRPESVPVAAIERMLGKLTLPTVHEAHETEWFN